MSSVVIFKAFLGVLLFVLHASVCIINVTIKLLVVNKRYFSMVELLHCLYCMVITMSHQQINAH